MADSFRILVVEDDSMLRKVIASLFAKVATVTEAESGNQAIQILKSESIDLIFSDVCMPDGTGVELLDWVQQSLKPVPPTLVLVTGQAAITREEAIQRGAHALIDKPFRVKDLLSIAQAIKTEIENGSRPRVALAATS